MIKNFRHKSLRDFFETGCSKGIRPDLQERIAERLDVLDNVTKLEDLNLPGYGLHPLKGEKKGRHAVSVNGPWRITFEWDGENAVKVDLEQYH